ncbi:DNA-binding MarR family transcriptional regulator [Bradyrhizobium sp. AZCC 2289]
MNFRNTLAVVTSVASGIGRAIAGRSSSLHSSQHLPDLVDLPSSATVVPRRAAFKCRNSILPNLFPPETQFLHAASVNRADMRQAYHFKELHEMEVNSHTLGFLLDEVARLLKRRFEQHARGSGLTRSQWQVLTYLDRNEGINQSRLAGLLDLEPITLSRIVDKLQSVRLIERQPDPTDRRVWTLHLTGRAAEIDGSAQARRPDE